MEEFFLPKIKLLLCAFCTRLIRFVILTGFPTLRTFSLNENAIPLLP